MVKPVKTGEWTIKGMVIFRPDSLGYTTLHTSVSEDSVALASSLSEADTKVPVAKLLTRSDSPPIETARLTSSQIGILATTTITGYAKYVKPDLSEQPIRYARVKVYDDLLDYPLFPKEVWTDNTGKFTVSGVDDDGEVYRFEVYSDTDGYTNKDAVIAENESEGVYMGYAKNVPISASGDIGTWTDNRGTWFIFDTIIEGYEFLGSVNDRNGFDYDKDGLTNGDVWNQPKIKVYWPNDHSDFHRTTSYYIHINNGDEWTPDVILHEYGHVVMDKAYDESYPQTTNCSPHWFNQPSSTTCALTEGWATFIFTAIENSSSTIWGNVESGLQRPNDVQPADQVEGEIAGIWWDIFDPANEGEWDDISSDIPPIWNVVITQHPNDIHDFWNGWDTMGYNELPKLWAIYYNHGINKDTTNPTTPSLSSPSGPIGTTTPTFNWNAATDDLSGIDYYQIQVDDNLGFGSPAINTTTTSTYYTAPSGVLSNGVTYHWRVGVWDKAGNFGGFTDRWSFTIDIKPDLTLQSSDISFSPSSPSDGDDVLISADISNIGDLSASNVKVRFSHDGTQIGGDYNITSIGAGGSASAWVTWNNVPQGTHTVEVTVDPGNAIAEANEGNNVSQYLNTDKVVG